eukprot:4713412-Prymnesium_polylepis.1
MGSRVPPRGPSPSPSPWPIPAHGLQGSQPLRPVHPQPHPGPIPDPNPLPHPQTHGDGRQVHIHGEVVFDQQQGLWFMADGWEKAL